MRQYHRWLSILAALFLLVVAATGVILQVQKLTGEDKDADREKGDRVESVLTTALPAAMFSDFVTRTMNAVHTKAPNAPIASVSLRSEEDEIQGVVTIAGDPQRQIVVDARSGRIISDERRETESLILRIHSGEILGEPGVILGILWGLALLILAVTGIWIYIDMFLKRRKARGKGQVFW